MAPTPFARTTTIELPECQDWDFSRPLEHCWRSSVWGVQVFRVFWVTKCLVFKCLGLWFRVFGVFEMFSVGFQGLVVGFYFGFSRTKTTPNVTWFDSDTLSKKCSKHLKNEVWTKKGKKIRWTKIGQNATWCSGGSSLLPQTRIVFRMTELFRKIDEDFAGSIRNPIVVNFSTQPLHIVTILFWTFCQVVRCT